MHAFSTSHSVRPEALASDEESVFLDGVSYLSFQHRESPWRLGTINPLWREHLPLNGEIPDAAKAEDLAKNGLWLRLAGETPPLALMCQGMGALWPGAGRELYESFPEARDAMDRVQAIASWDVLALLDERDSSRITQTRWQIPYLFLLEYAQWSYLVSLGLRPAMIMGHSLGELIALCFAGIYTPEVAWHILDTRAEHVARLEAEASEKYGMLAVHAQPATLSDLVKEHPSVAIANYNTPTQCILSGTKEQLLVLRKELRRRHIPAVFISVSLLFHHPSMRVLRDHSLLRLNGLQMQAPAIPVLSVGQCCPYPDSQSEICRFIADLDENPVRFADCLFWLRHKGFTHFLEIGPQEVLSGLIADTLPEASVYSCGRKGQERRSMREVCARLFAANFLDRAHIRQRLSVRGGEESSEPLFTEEAIQEKNAFCAEARPLLDLLAELTGIPQKSLSPALSLRSDLALRSSTFPLFLARAAKIYSTIPSFEDLVQAATLGDLVRLFTGQGEEEKGLFPTLNSLRLHPLQSVTMQGGQAVQSDFSKSLLPFPDSIAVRLFPAKEPCENAWSFQMLLADSVQELGRLADRVLLESSLAGVFQKTQNFCPELLPSEPLGQSFAHNAALLLFCSEDASTTALLSALTPFSTHKGKRLILFCPSRSGEYFGKRLYSALLPAASIAGIYLHVVDIALIQRRRYEEIGERLFLELSAPLSRHVLWCEEGEVLDPAESEKESKKDEECTAASSSKEIPFLPPPCAAPLGGYFARIIFDRLNQNAAKAGFWASKVFFSPETAHYPKILPIPFSCLLEPFIANLSTIAGGYQLTGFSDLDCANRPALEGGVVRRAHYVLRATGSLVEYGAPMRLFRGEATIDTLAANGRRIFPDGPLLAGRFWLGGRYSPHPPQNAALFQGSLAGEPCALSLPEGWRFISNTRFSGERLIASLTLPAIHASLLAQGAQKEYIFLLASLEASLQAARLLADCTENSLSAFDYSSCLPRIGLALLGRGDFASARLVVQKTCETSSLQRFDAALTDRCGEPCLLLYHLELENNHGPKM